MSTPQEVGGTHYNQGVSTTPWDLQRAMKTSGVPFVDARRSDVIKYVFRIKGDYAKQIEDYKKAKHCIEAAIAVLESEATAT